MPKIRQDAFPPPRSSYRQKHLVLQKKRNVKGRNKTRSVGVLNICFVISIALPLENLINVSFHSVIRQVMISFPYITCISHLSLCF